MGHRFLNAAIAGLALTASTSTPVQAQQAPVDCYILLCLPGGWPGPSCVHPKAVFLARIAPPFEPPVQAWNCPMGAAYTPEEAMPQDWFHTASMSVERKVDGVFTVGNNPNSEGREAEVIQIQEQIGILTPKDAFEAIQTIRVWQIDYTRRVNDDGDCTEIERSKLGRYNPQGDYYWTHGSLALAPSKFGLGNPSCAGTPREGHLRIRASAIEWTDMLGQSDFAIVRY
ncbi:MAG: hypothetical protein ACPGXY_06415 [Alphaproteobacteria bacterium]